MKSKCWVVSGAPTNTRKDMPGAARVIAAIFGLFLIAGSIFLVLAVRPFNWQLGSLSFGSVGLGADLVHSGIPDRWPTAALLWLLC